MSFLGFSKMFFAWKPPKQWLTAEHKMLYVVSAGNWVNLHLPPYLSWNFT